MTRIRLSLVPAAALLVLATAACSAAEASTAGPAAPAPTTATAAPASVSPVESAASNGELPAVATNGITLRVTGPDAPDVEVSYKIGTTETTDKDGSVPWQKTVDPAGEVFSISLIAMSSYTDELTCEIYIDGTKIDSHTASAASGGVASCDWVNKDN